MSTRLSRFFEQQRISRSLKPGQVAIHIGYTNTSKGGSRIRSFEQTGSVSKELFEKLAAFFQVNTEDIDKLVEEDRREFFENWLAWANEPIQPHLVVRLIAAVYSRRELSPDIGTIDEAEVWAASVARELRLKCCLVWSRRISIWFDETGRMVGRTEAVPGEANVPWMRIGGKPFVLDGDLHSPKPVVWLKKPEVGS
jgi:hypothetical protein